MIDFLVARNHRWEDIIDKYPVTLVKNLVKSGKDHDRLTHLSQVTGMSMAVLHAIDLSFNKGKGAILQTYFKNIERIYGEGVEDKKDKPEEGIRVNAAFMNLLNRLPKKEELDESG